MLKERSYQQVVSKADQKEDTMQSNSNRWLSANEAPIALLDPELGQWIRVIRPSRASLTYERME